MKEPKKIARLDSENDDVCLIKCPLICASVVLEAPDLHSPLGKRSGRRSCGTRHSNALESVLGLYQSTKNRTAHVSGAKNCNTRK